LAALDVSTSLGKNTKINTHGTKLKANTVTVRNECFQLKTKHYIWLH